MPARPELLAAWPIPAATVLSVMLRLPQRQRIRLELCDALGRCAAVPADGEYPAGASVATVTVASLARGVFFLRLHAEGTVTVRAVLLR
jgi:hypothetical protein